MSEWHRDQWGTQPQQGESNKNPPGPAPGYPQNYIPPPGPPPQASYQGDAGYGIEQKSPYDGDRFKPKKRINDPIFLIFFVLQVNEQLTMLRAHVDIFIYLLV